MTRKIDLSNYETVKERKAKFYKEHEDGRIIVKNITPEDQLMEYALFKAYVYANAEEQKKNLPIATGYAMEIRDKEVKVSQYGKEYESVNFTSWTENCEESAVGRALDNAGYSNKKCSANEIEQAQKNKTALSGQTYQPKANQQFKQNQDLPWVNDEAFNKSIRALLEKGQVEMDTSETEVLKILRSKFKVARKYEPMIKPTIEKIMIGE